MLNPPPTAAADAPAEPSPASDAASLRQTAPTLELVRRAIGDRAALQAKSLRLARMTRTLLTPREARRRLARLLDVGVIEAIPTRLQLAQLGVDMLRYFIEPGARDYYRSRGIRFGLHQLLRVLDDPSSMMDPLGIFLERDAIIGHVLQVTHANPLYDLELLEMFDDGVAQMAAQTRAMLDGTHPRARSIGAIVEDPAYHARLHDYIERYRRDPDTPELRRCALDARGAPRFVLAEETFGSMRTAFRYACRLPTRLLPALKHLRDDPTLDPDLCDPAAVARVREAFGRV